MEPKLLRQIHLPPTFPADRKLKRFLLLKKIGRCPETGLWEAWRLQFDVVATMRTEKSASRRVSTAVPKRGPCTAPEIW